MYMKINEFTTGNSGSLYYHVTETKNVSSIMKHGLIPKTGRRGIHATTNDPVIYLFNTITEAEEGVMNWLGDILDENDTLSLLEIIINSEDTVDDPELDRSASMTTIPIPASNIKIITNDF